MRSLKIILVTGALAISALASANITQDSLTKAQAVIDAAVEAYGGADRLAELDSAIVKSSTITYATNQSLKPGPPWDENSFDSTNAIRLSDRVFVNFSTGDGGGFEFDNGNIVVDDTATQIDYRAGTATAVPQADFDQAAGPFVRVTPVLLLKSLLARPSTSHYLGETSINDRPHDAISLVMPTGPALTLYFDRETHLMTASERYIPVFGMIRYGFSDYRAVDGIQFNYDFALYLNDQDNLKRSISSVEVNPDIGALQEVDASLTSLEAPAPAGMTMNEVNPGVFHIGGNGTYGLFVDMGDHFVAIGATGGAEARLAELRSRFPEKPLRYAVITHHHNDHLAGVATFVAEGATLLTTEEHEAVVRAMAGDDSNANIQVVKKSRTLSGGERKIKLRVIGPTAHTNRFLLAYLPDEKLIFEADHFALPASGAVPPAVSSTTTFAKALKKSRFKIDAIASAHSARIGTMDELKTAVKTKAKSR